MSSSVQTSNTVNPLRPDIIDGEFIATLKRAGVIEAYLFGSFARGEESADSDLDLYVQFREPFRLTDQLNLMVKLSRLIGREVEVLTDIEPVFKPYIMPTLVRIPL